MKKVIALILAAITILAIAALSGCGNKNKPDNTTPIQSNQTTTPTSPTQTDPITDPTQTTPDQTTASEPNIEPTTASEPTVTTEPTTAQTEPTTAQTEPTTVQTEPTTESTQATTEPVEIVPGYVEIKREETQWDSTRIYYNVTLPTGEEKLYVIDIRGESLIQRDNLNTYSISNPYKSVMLNISNTGKSEVLPSYCKYYMDGVLVADYSLSIGGFSRFGFGDNVKFDISTLKPGETHKITIVAELCEVDLNSSALTNGVRVGVTYTSPEITITITE